MKGEKLIVTQPGARTYDVMHFNQLGRSAVQMCVGDQYKSAHNPLVYRKRTGHVCERGGACALTGMAQGDLETGLKGFLIVSPQEM